MFSIIYISVMADVNEKLRRIQRGNARLIEMKEKQIMIYMKKVSGWVKELNCKSNFVGKSEEFEGTKAINIKN